MQTVVTVSSVHVLFTSHYLNSEDVPPMRTILISQILVLPDFTDVIVLSSHALQRFYPRFTRYLARLSHAPATVIISDPTESPSRNLAHDRSNAPKVAAMAWYFFRKSCVECSLREDLLSLFCFFYIAWYSSEVMDLNMLWLEAFIEGFIYNTNKQAMPTQGAPVTNMVFV